MKLNGFKINRYRRRSSKRTIRTQVVARKKLKKDFEREYLTGKKRRGNKEINRNELTRLSCILTPQGPGDVCSSLI